MAWKALWTLRCDECGGTAPTVAEDGGSHEAWPDWLSGYRVGWGRILFHICPACAAKGKPDWLIEGKGT